MNINISKLIGEKTNPIDISLNYELNNSELLQNLNILEVEPLKVTGKVYKNNGRIIVDAVFSGEAVFRCSRCLEEFKKNVSGNMNFDIPLEEKDDDNTYIEGDYLNLSTIIEEALAFSLPMKTLCKEECRGLCPICGQNLNLKECNCDVDYIDPRLEKLKDFFSKNEEV
ncbi:YceD family protein [Paramaledivibacter caminithermalis]|jgi:uncharacterized protein|nr:DUF177 domain-containing protein [Paramaledivibacter caminithermalis]